MYEALFAPGVIAGHVATVEALRPVAERLGTGLAQLALAWAIHQPGVSGVICGTRSPERAHENAAAAEIQLTPEDLLEIDALLA
jgi:myo-inositol catabolism protein IolS